MGNSMYFEGSETYYADCYGDYSECNEVDYENAVWVSQR